MSLDDKSKVRLSSCHPDLILLANEVARDEDCMVLVGHRVKEEQEYAFNAKLSELNWPNSKHNDIPSSAFDLVPKPLNWNDKVKFYQFSGIVIGIARRLFNEGKMHHKIRWGGDWDSDGDLHDQNLMDLVHFELLPPICVDFSSKSENDSQDV